MEPALCDGDIVVARAKKPTVGDVVIAKVQGREVIKRVTTHLPDSLFLQGDNKDYSTDSRQYGPVATRNVMGVVWYTHKSRKKR